MELDRGSLEALHQCGLEGPLDDGEFTSLLDLALRAAVPPAAPADAQEQKTALDALVTKHGDAGAATVKQAFAGLVALVLEAARHDASEEELSAVVEDRLTPERLRQVAVALRDRQTSIRAALARGSAAFPSVVAVDWRLDYSVQSNMLEQVRTPLYLISLTTRDAAGALGRVEFTASAQELQQLLAKCKDACNSVKHLRI